MFVKNYMKTPVKHRKYLGDDNDFNAPRYSDPVEIMCHIDAGAKFKTSENGIELFNAYTYSTMEKISVRDMLDDQVVIMVRPIYTFNGTISHYEAVVGEAKTLG